MSRSTFARWLLLGLGIHARNLAYHAFLLDGRLRAQRATRAAR